MESLYIRHGRSRRAQYVSATVTEKIRAQYTSIMARDKISSIQYWTTVEGLNEGLIYL